ncbi:MAG: tetratricopeptide repeat protein [Pirellulales bacterium]|nr:tetratricopeptide repeat protein [Pirellulales bacterium]
MNRLLANTWVGFSGCLAIACLGSMGSAAETPPGKEDSLLIRGEAVEGEVPATYRLPLVEPKETPPTTQEVAVSPSTSTNLSTEWNPSMAWNPSTAWSPSTEWNPSKATVVGLTTELPARADLAIPSTSDGLTSQLLPAVRRGYHFAQRGALFAARTEFIQVLRRVAQAKDATLGTDIHATQLAAGLRALDEAADFVPSGVQLEGELSVRRMASSHRTPVLSAQREEPLPHEASALYHAYAREQLSEAASGEQAGSMALYGLGKVHSRLAERSDDDIQQVRSAITMYAAALDACPANHLAANELGVLLCRMGHANEAVANFTRAIDFAPSATAYHNLAIAQHKIGLPAEAAANEQESQRLASLERITGTRSAQAGVRWVSPEEMARVSQSVAFGPARPSAVPPPPGVANRPGVKGPAVNRY